MDRRLGRPRAAQDAVEARKILCAENETITLKFNLRLYYASSNKHRNKENNRDYPELIFKFPYIVVCLCN
jgi:hypothetical protein